MDDAFKIKDLMYFCGRNLDWFKGPYALIRFSFGVLRSLDPDTIQRKSVSKYGLFLSYQK